MPLPTFTNKTDLVDIIYAADVNNLQNEVAPTAAGSATARYSTSYTSTDNVTLTDASMPVQSINFSSNSSITLPAISTANHPFYIANRSTSSIAAIIFSGSTLNSIPAGYMGVVYSDSTAGWKVITNKPYFPASSPGGRLTLTSGTPVTTSDVTASTNVYYTPFINNNIVLWTGVVWDNFTFSEITLALGTVTSGLPYDIFAYISSGSVAVEKLAWTNGTTRATGISLQDGRYCKTGDKTRLYLGTIYTTSTTQTADTKATRYVWNAYNRRLRFMTALVPSDTWVYSTGTYRAINTNTTNGEGRVSLIVGLSEDLVTADRWQSFSNDTSTTIGYANIGIDSTSVGSGQKFLNVQVNLAGYLCCTFAAYRGYLSEGFHFIQQLEKAQAVGVTTWYGYAAEADRQGGMTVEVFA